ncbi:MAG: hypothetical protein EOO50_05165 [Flavobacterium sp.]|uniref:hypothetical protein n=1 Tax=Flavobacterium sp. TaxID=239 RepID=UPI0012105385|nr:hypothetical protein [Flavobacterium sp.]RZJ67673.1 MAG: hypothetical protein EOO50_05165 [Flavobacterium sp.]
MNKKDLLHHVERLTSAIEQLDALDESMFVQAREKNMRLDFVRKWTLAPRAKKDKPMPAICLFGSTITLGKNDARGKLEKDLEITKRNIERL